MQALLLVAEHDGPTMFARIETCKLTGIEPHAYLADVITKIINGHPNSQIDDLLPWAYRLPRCSGTWPENDAYVAVVFVGREEIDQTFYFKRPVK
jgi:hypothetical protein